MIGVDTSRWMAALGRVSAEAGVLVLLVLAVQWLCRNRLPPRWRCALWLLVVARLMLPVSLSSVVSVFNLVPSLAPQHNESRRSSASSVSVPADSPRLVAPPAIQTVNPLLETRRSETTEPAVQLQPAQTPTAAVSSRQVASTFAPPPVSHRRAISWFELVFVVWLGGGVILGAYVLIASFRLMRRLARLPAMTDDAVLAVLDQCRERLGVDFRIEVIESPDFSTPALHGLVRPRLVLPFGFTRHFSASQLRFVFLHELAHVKRRDIPLNWLVALLQILHWFNPLVWLGFIQWRADRELACDAIALEAAGPDQNKEYGRTILRLLEGFTPRVAVPGLVGILEDKRQLHRRIGMIAGFRPQRGWRVASVLVLVALGVICLTDAQAPKEKGAAAEIKATNAVPEVRLGVDPVPADSANHMAITVTVLDNAGQPLAGAEVWAPYGTDWNVPPPRRQTDEHGRFVLQVRVPPREYASRMSNFEISASHPGYASRAFMWTSSAGDVYSGLPDHATVKLEKGIPIGAIVLDDQGKPLKGIGVLLRGSGYRGFSMGTDERLAHEYSTVELTDRQNPAAVTDDSGRWKFDHFPSDLKSVEITLVWPDGAREEFATDGGNGLNHRPTISIGDLLSQTAKVTLQEGVTVRGIVVDERGRPLSGVTIQEGYGHGNIERIDVFKTGADGEFERQHRVPRQWIYTATRGDRATASVIAQVESGMTDVRIVMPPPSPLRIHVTDDHASPIPGVELRVEPYRTEGQILDWIGRTDETGLAVWTNAPEVSVRLTAIYKPHDSPTIAMTREFRVQPDHREQTVVLTTNSGRFAQVQITASDATTHLPVKIRSVSAQYNGVFTFKNLAEPNTNTCAVEIHDTDFRIGMSPSYKLKIEADGFDPLVTDYFEISEGDQQLDLELIPNTPAKGVVLLPDGKPAADARIWVRSTLDSVGGRNLFMNAPGHYYGDGLTRADADGEGRYQLPTVQNDAPVIISHSDGFLETTVARLKEKREAYLEAYGSLEGRLLVAGKPKHGVNISLATLLWTPSAALNVSFTAPSDDNGRFTFTSVPPGEYKLYQWSLPKTGGTSGRAITETYQMPVTIRPGETSRVDYASVGRAVIGQAVADNSDVALDWLNDSHVLVLKQPVLPDINFEDFASLAAFRKANEASYLLPARLRQAREARSYPLDFEQDGSFRIEDVPPGNYELRIRVDKPGSSGQFNPFPRPEDSLARLTRDVVVPSGSGPLDLGTLVVAVNDKSSAGARKPAPELPMQTLDGKQQQLSSFRGKRVLLVFWATWSDRCTEQLAELRKLQSSFGQDDRLVILGVSVDDELDSTRKAVDSRSYTWSQAWLDPAARIKATKAFDVSVLPDMVLLDSQGRIVARDISGDHLAAAIRRELARN